jgi:hypothetical protein
MCDTKFKAGDRVVIQECSRHGTVMFVEPNGGLYPVLVLFDPKKPGDPQRGSSWFKESELRPAPVKVTSEKYRRLLYKYAYTGEPRVSYVIDDVGVRDWEKDPHFIGWVDKDWITSELEVTIR